MEDDEDTCLQYLADHCKIRRTSSDKSSAHTHAFVPNGYKSAPERLQFGPDFPHLNVLRKICQHGIGGEKSNCSSPISNKYISVYGPKEDLEATDNSKPDSEKPEKVSFSMAGSCPSLFERVKIDNTFTGAHILPRKQHSLPESGYIGREQKHNVKPDDLKIKTEVQETTYIQTLKVKDSTNVKKEKHHDDKYRMKINLKYFRNTRQLRIMLHTVEGLSKSHSDILVKLALINSTSKQKAATRKLSITETRTDLNEIVYIEPQDGKVHGKLLRLCLCKVSRYIRAVQPIATAVIALDDFETSKDTSIWLTLNKHRSSEKIQRPSDYEVEIVSDQPDTQANARVMPGHTLAPADLQLLIASSRALHTARSQQN